MMRPLFLDRRARAAAFGIYLTGIYLAWNLCRQLKDSYVGEMSVAADPRIIPASSRTRLWTLVLIGQFPGAYWTLEGHAVAPHMGADSTV
jgi:hypothetical protein